MKRTLALSALLFIYFLSCKKDHAERPATADLPAETIQYKYNDSVQRVHAGDALPFNGEGTQTVGCFKIVATSNTPGEYYFRAYGANYGNIAFSVYTDSLTPKTYTSAPVGPAGIRGATVIAIYGDVESSLDDFGNDYFSVTVTSHHDGVVSGKFEGKLSSAQVLGNSPGWTNARITEGEFEDIKVRY